MRRHEALGPGFLQPRLQVDLPPVIRELQNGRRLLSRYWRVGELLLERTGNQLLIPEWREYMDAFPEERKEMEVLHPIFRDVNRAVPKARQLHRERNAQADAFLFRWGYTPTLRNPDNEGRDLDEVRRTPVLLGQ